MKADGSWPAIEYEDRPWRPNLADPRVDVFQRLRLERPYQAAVPARIADLDAALSGETLRLADQASAELVRFDAEMAALPTPMPAVLLRSESASSSQIEHLTANARNLALASLGLTAGQNAVLVAGNARAMAAALAVSGPLTPAVVLDIHRALLEATEPDIAGRWRAEQVWIGASSLSPHEADFVPPHQDRLPACLADWAAYADRSDPPALAQAAIAHAQFETIHPFVDGNGRTGRVLIQSVLRRRGLIRSATVPVSSGLLRDTASYFDALSAYRAGHPEPIIEQMAAAVLAAVGNARLLAADIAQIRQDWLDQVQARSDSSVWKLADLLFAQPVVTAAFAAAQLGVTDRAARNAIAALQAAGVLTPVRRQRRSQAWQADAILTAMDEFAARAGRRRWQAT
ncbi:MAG: Fic family protein [Propionibacteriaceae bacterium]|nr:Fic family protein [Propionibacteriaceae bacterium]